MQARQTLRPLIDQCLEAFAVRDPERLPLAMEARYTENCQRLAWGTGLWATATGLGRYRNVFVDRQHGQAACFAVVQEMDRPAIVCLRLKATGEQVDELETLVARSGDLFFNPDALIEPLPIWAEPVNTASRKELIRAANLYFDAVERSDGSIIPISDKCIRIENGVHTACNPQAQSAIGRMPVADAIGSGNYAFIASVRDRSFPVVDEDRGIVLGMVVFDIPGNVRAVDVVGVGRVELPPIIQKPQSLMIAEAFKVAGGVIQHIEAVIDAFPFGTKPGWPVR
jgi:hypothetical protein